MSELVLVEFIVKWRIVLRFCIVEIILVVLTI